eukprot:TRINITY_DN480_c0_g1_i9.p1 TRINITY_DN480_c0_g1~~TRINITY_DN480_c0_g1_i9.p1  ORF type:complete len:111 (+),score=12.45 TRINITY_DN480_c0_g1_i9:75-407(+)
MCIRDSHMTGHLKSEEEEVRELAECVIFSMFQEDLRMDSEMEPPQNQRKERTSQLNEVREHAAPSNILQILWTFGSLLFNFISNYGQTIMIFKLKIKKKKKKKKKKSTLR